MRFVIENEHMPLTLPTSVKRDPNSPDAKLWRSLYKLHWAAICAGDTIAKRVVEVEAGILTTTRERSNSAVYLGRRNTGRRV